MLNVVLYCEDSSAHTAKLTKVNIIFDPLSPHRSGMPSAGSVIVGAISELCYCTYQPVQRYQKHISLLPFCNLFQLS